MRRWRTWLAVAAAAAAAPAEAATPPELRPDIVMIVADDLGWKDVGYHGSAIRTPHLDRLAAEGVRLEQHYVFPSCVQTRVALVSGRDPASLGAAMRPGFRWNPLPPDTRTLADTLQARGYETAITGKWHVGSAGLQLGPQRYGFERSHGFVGGAVDPFTHRSLTDATVWHRSGQPLEEEGHATDLIALEALRVLETPRDRPLFLIVAFSAPHLPLREASEWTKPYRDLGSRAPFAASVSHMDHAVGRIAKALADSERRRSTLLVFFSDNGASRVPEHPEHPERWGLDASHTLGDNTPLRGWKAQVYEGGIRVPTFVHWPGVLASGSRSEVGSVLDWYPTLASLAGSGGPPEGLDGRDIWPLLAGSRSLPPPRLRFETPGQLAIREGDWKLVVDRGTGRRELFDLAADPFEQHDRSAEHPDHVRRLGDLLGATDRETTPDVPREDAHGGEDPG